MPGHATNDIVLDPNHPPEPMKITLKPAEVGGVYGHLLDLSGKPSNSFYIRISDTDNAAKGPLIRFSASVDGAFSIMDLPEGNFSLDFRCLEEGKLDLRVMVDRVEVHRGQMYGPLIARLQEPVKK